MGLGGSLALPVAPKAFGGAVTLPRGYEVYIGRPETLRQQLQDGRKMGHPKDLLAANQQVDYGRCSRITLGVTLRFCE
jgi:hypothetical protein